MCEWDLNEDNSWHLNIIVHRKFVTLYTLKYCPVISYTYCVLGLAQHKCELKCERAIIAKFSYALRCLWGVRLLGASLGTPSLPIPPHTHAGRLVRVRSSCTCAICNPVLYSCYTSCMSLIAIRFVSALSWYRISFEHNQSFLWNINNIITINNLKNMYY